VCSIPNRFLSAPQLPHCIPLCLNDSFCVPLIRTLGLHRAHPDNSG
jgi:hypothetical protein